jgi:transposase
MMTALLLYAYCVGVFSSRKVERATYEDVAFRVLASGEQGAPRRSGAPPSQ